MLDQSGEVFTLYIRFVFGNVLSVSLNQPRFSFRKIGSGFDVLKPIVEARFSLSRFPVSGMFSVEYRLDRLATAYLWVSKQKSKFSDRVTPFYAGVASTLNC
ncbi:unnamed protein product [Brassica rapa]|uniref:Uncharacterized protein n=2 Tax=Brassica TaxID=3705 RepID=A0A8D9HVY5_BRACM|nr:unnamed protein product [Brassica napus]CAG7906885.1 unnamed protein product [Brassica rapa]